MIDQRHVLSSDNSSHHRASEHQRCARPPTRHADARKPLASAGHSRCATLQPASMPVGVCAAPFHTAASGIYRIPRSRLRYDPRRARGFVVLKLGSEPPVGASAYAWASMDSRPWHCRGPGRADGRSCGPGLNNRCAGWVAASYSADEGIGENVPYILAPFPHVSARLASPGTLTYRGRPTWATLDTSATPAGSEWCPGAELNHRHRDFQSRALPTELPGLSVGTSIFYAVSSFSLFSFGIAPG